jgi:hypothetical protein
MHLLWNKKCCFVLYRHQNFEKKKSKRTFSFFEKGICYHTVVTGVVTMNIKLCVLCIAGTQKIDRESCKRETGNRMAQHLLPALMLSQVRNILACIHTKQLLYQKTAFDPNWIIDQPEERELSIPVESQSQKNKDTLPASWQSFHEILPTSTVWEIQQIVVRLWTWKLHVFLDLCCPHTCTGKLFYIF